MSIFTYTAVLLVIVSSVHPAKILGVFNIPSVSHQVVYQPIWRELSLRGHDVTVVTPNPLKDPSLTNLTEIDVSFMYGRLQGFSEGLKEKQDHWRFMKTMFEFAENFTEQVLSHKEVQALINDTSLEFDVVLAEYMQTFPSAFAVRFKCPLIAVASLSVLSTTYRAMGNPVHPILHPDFTTSAGRETTFLERVDIILFTVWQYWKYHFVSLPRVDKILKKHFGSDFPYLGEYEGNISMLFVNTNPVIHTARAYLPSVVEMGRMHLKPKKPLPEDLQRFLDESTEGVIYFSLGSNVKSIHIDKEKRKIIMETFAGLPYKILWKFEADEMEGKPDNVKISKWLPQQDLLGHPNIKLFITQCGLQSTEEAIMNHVPLLGLPFFADQQFIANRYVALGVGLTLDFSTLTKDTFKKTILEVIQNSKYKKRVIDVGNAMTDEPNTGLERTVWWTEYVIRHKGAPYFKSPALDMPWYQYWLLDVLGFFLTLVLLTIYVAYKVFIYIRNKYAVLYNVVDSKKQKLL